MDYSGTIKRGWQHVWNNRFLWALGFLAALGSGASFSNSNYSANSGDFTAFQNWLTPERTAALAAGATAFICIAFIVGIILWLVSLSAYGGLIGGVAQLELGLAKPTFGSTFRLGRRRLGRLVGLNLVLFLVPIVLLIALALSFLVPAGVAVSATQGDGSSLGGLFGGLTLVFFCLLCVIMLLMLILSFVYPFAFRGIILRDLGVMDSIRHGWRVLRDNLGEMIVLGLAFILITIVIFIIAAAILAPVAVVVGVPFVALMNANATFLQGLLAVLGILIGLILFGLISAIATAWQSATFTLAYLRWTGKDVVVN